MGASLVYLEKPNKEIDFELGENGNFKFAAGGMQGWRINMVSNELNLFWAPSLEIMKLSISFDSHFLQVDYLSGYQ